MPFNSIYFFLFLLIAACLYYVVRTGVTQKWILVAASVLFPFFFNPLSGIVLIVICLGNYYGLKQLSSAANGNKRAWFYVGLLVNILILLLYKIIQDVLSDAKLSVLQGFDNSKWIILGIGFYILQVIGYYLDIFKRGMAFTISLPNFVLGLAFFSKLPSGPLLNLKNATKEFSTFPIRFKEGNFSYALQRILLGLFKKMALADRLMPYVHNIFDEHNYINGLMIYLGPILFTIQLYLDFSGYIDIAIGSARLFGIRLPENFYTPLRSTSIVDFWRRWHITLVNWLTNYIFYPVSYTYRTWKGKGLAIAVVCTFIVSALWHGIAITFLLWAACHFSYIIFENRFFSKSVGNKKSWVQKVVGVFIVWHLVAFSNLFFRSPTLGDVGRLFHDFQRLPFLYQEGLSFKGWLINGGQDIESEFNFRFSFFLCLLFLAVEKKMNRYACSEKYSVVFVALMIVLIAVFGMFNTGERFIYLQF